MDFWFLLGLIGLATLLLPWINFFSIRRLREDIESLKNQIEQKSYDGSKFRSSYNDPLHVQTEQAQAPKQNLPSALPKEPVKEMPAGFSVPRVEASPVYEEPVYSRENYYPEEPEAKPAHKPSVSLEQNIGTKISVWLGAIALIFAAFYLVKYSIDQGFLSPPVRLSLSGLFGGFLVCAGQWLCNRKHIANAERIAQGLVGAGIVTLYVCLYAALNLYQLITPGIAFAGMGGVTAVAVIMSLRHGQPIAIFGIIGGLLTPFLVGSDSPNVPLLFTYLFVLYGGIVFFLVRHGWWLLSILLLGGVLLWPVLWLMTSFNPVDYKALVVFVSAVCLASLFATGSRTRSGDDSTHFRIFNTLAMLGSALIVFAVGFKLSLDLFDWSMLQLISLAILTLVFFRIDQYRHIFWAKMALDLILFALWVDTAPAGNIAYVAALMSAVYVALPLWIMLRAHATFFGPAQSIFTVSLSIISYLQLKDRFGDETIWAGGAFVLAAVFVLLTQIASKLYRGFDARDILRASYASTASFFISAGLAIALPSSYLPLAFAGQIVATLLIHRAVPLDSLKSIACVLSGAFVLLNWKYCMYFVQVILASLHNSTAGYTSGIVEGIDYKLLLPCILTGAAYFLALPYKDWVGQNLKDALLGITAVLALAYGYIFIRQMFYGDDVFGLSGFIERGCITFMIAAMAGTFFFIDKERGWHGFATAAKLLAAVVLFRLTYYDLWIQNPYWESGQFLGDIPVVHAGTLVYGAGALICALCARYSLFGSNATVTKGLHVLGLLFLFMLSSIIVAQMFRGGHLYGQMQEPELYGYSIAWLLTGLALLAYGIRYASKTARIASLCFILLTVLKVFLVDTSALKDLYRVFSFLGLGASLIGLSFFYSRYVFKREK